MKKIIKIFIITCLLIINQLLATTPKNIILLISDGMGFNHVEATNYYQYGENGKQVYEDFPVSCAMSTYNVNGEYNSKKAWHNFKYLIDKWTDSAAADTAMSTGTKTHYGAIGVDKEANNLKHVIEFAEKNKKATGVITSVYLSHSTPAGFVAHNPDRHEYQEIAREMIMDSKVDVMMGCGHPLYNDNGEKIAGEEEKFDYQNQ
ncbi:MAG: alkaline phosphatase, partial [Desulfotignum sp.]